MGTTLVRLKCVDLGSDLYLMTPIDTGARPEHPIFWPPGIWGPTDPRPTHPIAGLPGFPGYNPPGPIGGPPGIWGPTDPFPTHPIVIPPPNWKPPEGVTPPGPGEIKPIGGLQPVNPIVQPDFILVYYPGYGWVAVGKPEAEAPPPEAKGLRK